MKQQIYKINDKEYSRDQLIEIGRENNSGFYWISRMLGIIFFCSSLFVVVLIGLAMLILKFTGVFDDPSFPIWVFFIPLGLFGSFTILGIILFIVSFTVNNEEKYIKVAIKYLSKKKLTTSDGEPLLSKRDSEALKRYERLYKGGVITKEEYEEKTKEIIE